LKIDIWDENKVKASRYLWCVKYSHIIKTCILLDYISYLIYCKEKCKMVCYNAWFSFYHHNHNCLQSISYEIQYQIDWHEHEVWINKLITNFVNEFEYHSIIETSESIPHTFRNIPLYQFLEIKCVVVECLLALMPCTINIIK
jgi:hypothetical protein